MRATLIIILTGALASGCVRREQPGTQASAQAKEEKRFDVSALRVFFRDKTVVEPKDIIEAFGPPSRFTPLNVGETKNDATLEHSWWNYRTGDDENVSIQVDHAKVGGIFWTYHDASGASKSETFRKP